VALARKLIKDIRVNGNGELMHDETFDVLIGKGKWLSDEGVIETLSKRNLEPDDIPPEYSCTLNDRISEFLAETADSYIQAARFGTDLSFARAGEWLEDAKKLVGRYESADFSSTPHQAQNTLFSSFDNFIGQMKEIEALNMEQNPRQKRQEILHAVADAYQQIYTACNQLNPALSVNVGIAGRGETESVLEQLLVKAKAGADQIENLKAQSEQGAKSISEQAGKSGVAAEARHFAEEARTHKGSAFLWLIGIAIISAILLVVAGYFYFYDKPPKSYGMAWNHFIPKFSILGLLVFLDIVLVGLYRAERHNAVVNQHRANALNTFETMTAATLTQDVKDALTLTAAEAIYAPQETGFAKRAGNPSSRAAEILTTLRNNN
jgi:hypothetical protein